MITIILPIPNKELNPNVNRHFYQKAKVKAVARGLGYELSKQYFGMFTEQDMVCVEFVVHKGTARKYDLDNVLAATKSVNDGVFDGLGINDNQIDKIVVIRGEIDRVNPRIEMTIKILDK